MNIALLMTRFPSPTNDPCPSALADVVRALAQKHYVRVFPLRQDPPTPPTTWGQAHIFPLHPLRGENSEAYWNAFYEAENAIIRHHQAVTFDVVHAFGADEAGFLAVRLGKRLALPSFITLTKGELVGLRDIRYGLQLTQAGAQLVYESLKGATYLLASSQSVAQQLYVFLRSHSLDANRVRLVPFGIDMERFCLPPSQQERPYEFLHVAPLLPVKRQDLLLRLLARMPAARLHIVGDGFLRPYLEKLARDLRLDERVTFHGAMPRYTLPHFYQNSQCVLLTSQYETFGAAAIEALACGANVVATQTGVYPEVTKTAPVNDLVGLLATVVSRSRSQSRKTQEARREKVESTYSLPVMLSALENLYSAPHLA